MHPIASMIIRRQRNSAIEDQIRDGENCECNYSVRPPDYDGDPELSLAEAHFGDVTVEILEVVDPAGLFPKTTYKGVIRFEEGERVLTRREASKFSSLICDRSRREKIGA